MPLTPAQILEKLKKVAPHILVDIDWTVDSTHRWDFPGPDPADAGYVAYSVDVSAEAIVDGEQVDGHDYLGGVYEKPYEEFDPDVHGYFLDMVDSAIDDLGEQTKDPVIAAEIASAQAVIKRAYAIRHAEEAEGQVRKQDWSPRGKRRPKRRRL